MAQSGNPHAQPAGSRPPAAEAPTRVGKYEIQKKIGAGGMGAVYLALDSVLKRSVALKVLPREKAANPTLVKRFKAEAEAAARLVHDNVVMIYDAGEAEGLLYIAMEFVDGTDVANLVDKRGVMPVKRTVDVIRQVALALQHAFKHKIVHRDIKPGNLLIRRDGVVKLADLGLARTVDEHADTSITRAGTTVGTIDYMSPEQARNSKAADVRSDLYSLGCTWYFMLTGSPPFPDGSMTEKLRAHAVSALPDPRGANPAVSEAIIAVLRRMTEKDPAQRYQSPAELIADLETASHASDMVSEAILGELDGEAGAKRKRKPAARRAAADDAESAGVADGEPPRRRPVTVADLSGSAFKPPRADRRDQEGSETSRKVMFYGLLTVVVGGVLSGLAWMAMQYGSSLDGPAKAGGNPFATATIGDGSSPEGGAAAEGPEQRLPGANNVGGGPPVAGQSSQNTPRTTRIGQDAATGAPTVDGAPPGGDSESTGGGGTDPAGGGKSIGGEGRPVGVGPGAVGGGPARTKIGAGRGDDSSSGSPDGSAVSVGGAEGAKPGGAKIGSQSGTGPSPGAGSSGGAGVKGIGGGQRKPITPAEQTRRRQEDSQLPPWATKSGGDSEPKLPRLVVRRGAPQEGRLGSLNEALSQIPAEGAVIVLEGPGPFPLDPIAVVDKARVVIRDDDGPGAAEPPLVVLRRPEQYSAGSLFAFVNTAVELQGVHLGWANLGQPLNPDDALLQIHGGRLTMRDCSITVAGTGPALAAVKLTLPDPPPAEPSRVLVEQCVVRGRRLTALLIPASRTDVVVRRSLLWSGEAPAIRLSGAAGDDNDRREVRLISTTAVSSASAVQYAGNADQPVPTTVEWVNSLGAAPAGASAAALCVFDGWTAAQMSEAARSGRLTWTSRDSLFLGWKPLIRLEPGAIAVAADVPEWLKSWGNPAAMGKSQVQDAPWPAQEIAQAPHADPVRLTPESLGRQQLKTPEGGWPGCAVDLLSVASAAPLDALLAAANRPKIPVGLLAGPATAEVIQIDLNKQDLGRILAGKRLASGTQVVATGSGARQSSPIVIQNAWVRLRFEQAEGPPLVLSPKVIDSATSSPDARRGDAFITVVSGGLEITGGALTLPAGEKQPGPRWLIQATDSDLALVRCRLQGPVSGTSRSLGLVQWVRAAGTAPLRPFEAPLSGYAVFEQCFLFGSGTLIEADLRQRGLFIRNSVLVSRDDLVAGTLLGTDGQLHAAISLETSTFSAAGTYLRLAAAPLTAPAESPLRVWADRCVFGPALRGERQAAAPTLVAYSGPLLETRQLAFQENRCGYAPDVAAFLREDSAAAERQSFEQAWRGQWGESQVLDPLTGPQGVVLKAELPQRAEDRVRLEPADFTLHSACRGATWDDGERPIGAPLATLEFPPIRAAAGSALPATATKGKSPKAPPGGNQKPAF